MENRFNCSGQLVEVIGGAFEGQEGVVKNNSKTIDGKYQVHFKDGAKGLCASHNLKIIGYYDKRGNKTY